MKTLHYLTIAILLNGLYSCTQVREKKLIAEPDEQIKYQEDSLSAKYVEYNEFESHREKTLDHFIPQATEGNLVYYCPDKMIENTCHNVSVSISTSEVKRAIIKLAKRVQQSSGDKESEITRNIFQSSIKIYPKVKVELKYDDGDFVTIYKPEKSDLNFDGHSDMNWDWIIKPCKVGKTQLSLIVSAYDKKYNQWVSLDIPPKIFDIMIHVDPRSYLSRLWGFFGNNPEWIFAHIFFPVVGFYSGRRRKRKIKNEQ